MHLQIFTIQIDSQSNSSWHGQQQQSWKSSFAEKVPIIKCCTCTSRTCEASFGDWNDECENFGSGNEAEAEKKSQNSANGAHEGHCGDLLLGQELGHVRIFDVNLRDQYHKRVLLQITSRYILVNFDAEALRFNKSFSVCLMQFL